MKKERWFVKRAVSAMLAMGLVMGSVAGCGKSSSDSSSPLDTAGQNSKEYVFSCDPLGFSDGKDYGNISMVGDRIYVSSYGNNGSISIMSFNYDGSDVKTMSLPEAENQGHGYMTFDKEGNIYCVLQNYAYDPDEDPHILDGEGEEEGIAHAGDDEEVSGEATDAVSSEASGNEAAEAASSEASENEAAEAASSEASENGATDSDPQEKKFSGNYDTEIVEDEQFLVKYDSTGNEIFRIDLEEGLSEDEYFSMYKMIYTEEYGLVTSSNFGIRSLDESTKSFKMILDTKDESSEFYEMSLNLYNGFNGKTYASCWGESGMELRSIDLATGKMGEKSSQFQTFDDYQFFEGKGYDLYVSKSDGVYGYDANKDVIEKIMDYTDSDLNVNYALSSIVAISDAEFVANLPTEGYNYELCRLTKVPADQVKDRTVITMAGNMLDYNVRQFAYKFNQSNPDYKIKVVDYSTLNNEDDWNAGLSQFNMDIVSGNTPDIMCFTTDEPVDSYINKGLFIDLMTYIKNDPELKDTEFVENVFDAFKTGDKLFQLVPSFNINTVAAKTSNLKGKDILTIKDCMDLTEAKGINYMDAWGINTQETILNYGLMTAGDQFIDWENKKCSFDSEDFIELLEFSNKFPKETPDSVWEEYDDMAYMKDEALFSFVYLNNFRAYKRTKDGTFGGDITFIGFPNNAGTNRSVISPACRYAISSKTKYADICWEFIRQFLLEEYQDGLTWEFPIRKSSFDKQATESMDRPYWIDSDGVKQYEDDVVYSNSGEIKISPLNQQEVDFMKNYISSISNVYSPNQNVSNIIFEEASAFFSGQKSAQEVADIIQSRLTIYVNENS